MSSKNTESEPSNTTENQQNSEVIVSEQQASFAIGIQFLGGLFVGMMIISFFIGYYGWFLGAKIPNNLLIFSSVFSVICGFLAVFLKKMFWKVVANMFGFLPE
jgi:hypothetical protein